MICCLNFCFKAWLLTLLEVKRVGVGPREACWRATSCPPPGSFVVSSKEKKRAILRRKTEGLHLLIGMETFGVAFCLVSGEHRPLLEVLHTPKAHVRMCPHPWPRSICSSWRKVPLIHHSLSRGRVLPSPPLAASFTPSPVAPVQPGL